MVHIAFDSPLCTLITKMLGNDYMISVDDIEWLREVNGCIDWSKVMQERKLEPQTLIDAFKKAVKRGAKAEMGRIDPYELLIDAGFCDAYLKPTDKVIDFNKQFPQKKNGKKKAH